MARVWVAMSGGVDSSVAAALLLEAGHEVTGVTMQLWPSGDAEGGCCSVVAVRDARRVCDLLGIAHYTLNYRDIFEREVIARVAGEYGAGRTPNPCIDCNDRVKFADLLAKTMTQGADALATGHYARIVEGADGEPSLARGLDAAKDQSYFLYRLTRAQMRHVLFPVGELEKDAVRAMAERFGLPVAAKAESQDVCFAASGELAAVVASRSAEAAVPGPIVDVDGRELGRHDGIGGFTVGQRKGLGLGGTGEPLFVVAIEARTATVVVGPRRALTSTRVECTDVVWHAGDTERVECAVRYRMPAVPATARYDGVRLTIELDEPVEAIAPGQAAVCYRGDIVVGGGVIECAS